jgi:hypothetical protein
MTSDTKLRTLSLGGWWRAALTGAGAAMQRAQRESWVRGEMALGSGHDEQERSLKIDKAPTRILLRSDDPEYVTRVEEGNY